MLAFGFGTVNLFGIIAAYRTNVQLLPVYVQADKSCPINRTSLLHPEDAQQQAIRLF